MNAIEAQARELHDRVEAWSRSVEGTLAQLNKRLREERELVEAMLRKMDVIIAELDAFAPGPRPDGTNWTGSQLVAGGELADELREAQWQFRLALALQRGAVAPHFAPPDPNTMLRLIGQLPRRS
jgi:hypothetical protein